MSRVSRFVCAPLLAALFLTVSQVASAQNVDAIIEKNIQAKGGRATLAATESVRTTGKGTMQGAEVTVVSTSKRPHFLRNEMTMAGQTMVQVFDGTTLWLQAGGTPPQALPPGPMTEAMKRSSQIDSPLLDYKAKGTKIELGEPLTADGRTLTHLVVSPAGAPTMHYYLDPETGLESRMVIDVEEGSQKMTMELRFSDYETIDGRTVPMTVTQFVNGREAGRMQFEKIEFNIPLDDSRFRMSK